ncbi:MarR family winged helix-turn-helix transcriptional regulator [Microbacterium sp. CIAB417]|uniref:MarR family winged helix-turn-helix transcriptional regulator n=1 Tax=Microbacterium sp. CIAB417 TaxID=2860287 RepID=UPI001FAE5FE9|nr:MarR family transcriptional regulator [Microbacterium sp. CIAB417]
MGSPQSELLSALTRLATHWSSASTQSVVAAAAGVEVDPIDIPPLYVLGLEGPARAGDLAVALRLSRPTMSKQLSRLERGGFIERAVDPSDARGTIVRLTETGHTVHQRLVAQGIAMMTEALNDWDAAESTQFAGRLTRFVDGVLRTTSAPHPDGRTVS